MKLAPHAMYAIKTTMGFQLFHANGNGNVQIGMYRDGRGACKPGHCGYVSMTFAMIQREADRINNHDHWIEDIVREGVLVATHVVDPLKLTSRDYRKMARKAAEVMK